MSEVHVWDMGLLHKFFHTPGGKEWGGARFAKLVRNQARPIDDDWAEHVVLALDTHGTPTWRHSLLPSYKGHRPKMSDEDREALEKQYTTALEMTADFCCALSAPGYEADDIVGTVARAADDAGFDVVVFSHDKDMAQLIGPNTKLHDGKDFVTQEAVRERFGVDFWQVADYLAIAGDTCDGVPGVRGLGPVAAAEMLNTHGTLEAAIKHATDWQFHSVPIGKAYLKLSAQAEQARLCRRLIELDYKAPVRLPWVPQKEGA